jgi:hypothetical protein
MDAASDIFSRAMAHGLMRKVRPKPTIARMSVRSNQSTLSETVSRTNESSV